MSLVRVRWRARNHVIASVMVCMMLSTAVPCTLHAKEFELPRDRKASEILPPEMIQGPYYRIQEKVASYGYMHQYTVDSQFGAFEVTGDAALRKLLKEIRAIGLLKQIGQTDAFGASLKEAAKKPVAFGANLIEEPVATVSGVPKGVYQIFSHSYTALTSKRDPRQDEAYESALFLSSYKRQYASQLGVDVYSSNAVLQKELNRVGWAGAFGSFGFSAALSAVGGAAVLVSTTRLGQSLNELLTAEPPQKLQQINEGHLAKMGVPADLSQRFLDSAAFSPRHDTIITASLRALTNASGRKDFVQLIASAPDEEAANFYQQMAETMRGYHEGVSPIKKIAVEAGLALAKAGNGTVLLPFPLDHGVWTERAERVISGLTARYDQATGTKNRYELWVTGTLSPVAKQELQARRIGFAENVDQRIEFMD
jgi:hypothetical protein